MPPYSPSLPGSFFAKPPPWSLSPVRSPHGKATGEAGACLSSGMPRFVALGSPPRCSVASVSSCDGEAETGLAQGRNARGSLPLARTEPATAAPSSKGAGKGVALPCRGEVTALGSILPVCQDHFQPREFITSLAFPHFTAPTFLYHCFFFFCPYKCLLNRGLFPMFLISSWPLLTGTELWCSVHHCLLRILDSLACRRHGHLSEEHGMVWVLGLQPDVRARSALDRRSVSPLPTGKPVLGMGNGQAWLVGSAMNSPGSRQVTCAGQRPCSPTRSTPRDAGSLSPFRPRGSLL